MKKLSKFLLTLVCVLCFGLLICGCDFVGTGKSAYEIAVEHGFIGSEEAWLESLKGSPGKSAYEIAKDEGFPGSVTDWLLSLKGANGSDGNDLTAQSLFDLAVNLGLYENTKEGYSKFLRDYISDLKEVSSTTVQETSSKCINQVVAIYSPLQTKVAVGAGVVYKIDRENKVMYILTNYHVILNEDEKNFYDDFWCYGYGAENFSKENGVVEKGLGFCASIVGGSATYDLALLKVENEEFDKIPHNLMEVTFCDKNVQVGTTAIAIGNPLGSGLAVTSGVVSVDCEYISVKIGGHEQVIKCIRMDTSVNGGNSGGGLFNSEGKLIGIVNAGFSASAYENIENAICVDVIKAFVENLMYFEENKETYPPSSEYDKTYHTQVTTREYNFQFDGEVGDFSNEYDELTFNNKKSFIYVTSVEEGSLEEQMGLKVDDKILSVMVKRGIDTKEFKLTMYYDIFTIVLELRPDDEITYVVERLVEDEKTQTALEYITLSIENFIET